MAESVGIYLGLREAAQRTEAAMGGQVLIGFISRAPFLMVKLETHRLSPKKCASAQSRSRRMEKPLLHKVLNTASFKAPRAATPRVKNTKAVLDKENIVMGDLDTEVHDESSIISVSTVSRLFLPQTPTRN